MRPVFPVRNTLLAITLALASLATARPAHAEFQGDVYSALVDTQRIEIHGSRCSFYSYVLGECPNHPMGWQEAFWWWSVRAQAAVQNASYPDFGASVQAALTLKAGVDKKFNDSCYNAGESVAQWLTRTRLNIQSSAADTAIKLAANEVLNINATATSFSQLDGYINQLLSSVGAKQGKLTPQPC